MIATLLDSRAPTYCLVLLLIVGCSPASTGVTPEPRRSPPHAPASATAIPAPIGPISCGFATATAPDPVDPSVAGVLIGPLLFPTGGQSAEITFDLGGLNKVVPLAEVQIDSPLTIRGWRCADGQPLRFSAKVPKSISVPLTQQQEESIGDPQFHVAPTGPLPEKPRRLGFGGYWLWSAPGLWKIELAQGTAVLGDFVLEAKARAG